MFQADALLPWKSVLHNVLLGPILTGELEEGGSLQARDWLRRVGLAGFEDRYPHQLSGGMRKRVAMAAALINEPDILIMDEPFGALDVQTKAIMSTELLGLWEQLRPSVIFITHDLDEAVALADRVVVMTSGPGLGQGGLRHRPAAPARFGPGDPLPAPLPRTPAPDLGLAQRRGRARLRTRPRRCRHEHHVHLPTAATRAGLPVRGRRQGGIGVGPTSAVAPSRPGLGWLASAFVGIVLGGWQFFTAWTPRSSTPLVDPFFFGQPSGIAGTARSTCSSTAPSSAPSGSTSSTTMKEAVVGFALRRHRGRVPRRRAGPEPRSSPMCSARSSRW